MAKNRKIMPFYKNADKRLSDIKKGLTFAASAVFEIAVEAILAKKGSRPANLRMVMGHTVDSVTSMGRTHADISGTQRTFKACLKRKHSNTMQQENFRFLQRIC